MSKTPHNYLPPSDDLHLADCFVVNLTAKGRQALKFIRAHSSPLNGEAVGDDERRADLDDEIQRATEYLYLLRLLKETRF